MKVNSFFLITRCSVWIRLVGVTLVLVCACVCVCCLPPSEVTNPIQIMFSVLRGMRPEISLDSLPAEIPSRNTLISLMTTGWTSNPDERPSFLSKCDHLYCETRQVFFFVFFATSDVAQLKHESATCSRVDLMPGF